jgi:hypothetical protein
MLLTDPALQYWSCVAAVLASGAVLALWNKVHGPIVVKGLSRFGLLLGGYLTTAVAVLVSVNIAYGGLIVSVSDLFADVNPPMGQFAQHSACGSGKGPGLAARANVAASSAATAEADGEQYADPDAPPPGVDPALGGAQNGQNRQNGKAGGYHGHGFGRACQQASAVSSSVASPVSTASPTSASSTSATPATQAQALGQVHP